MVYENTIQNHGRCKLLLNFGKYDLSKPMQAATHSFQKMGPTNGEHVYRDGVVLHHLDMIFRIVCSGSTNKDGQYHLNHCTGPSELLTVDQQIRMDMETSKNS